MTKERAWFYCPIREHWVPVRYKIAVDKGFKVRGYHYTALCRSCAQDIQRRKSNNATVGL